MASGLCGLDDVSGWLETARYACFKLQVMDCNTLYTRYSVGSGLLPPLLGCALWTPLQAASVPEAPVMTPTGVAFFCGLVFSGMQHKVHTQSVISLELLMGDTRKGSMGQI